MRKNIYIIRTLFIGCLLAMATGSFAQITNPAPYCQSQWGVNYNMVNTFVFKGFTHSLGAAGNPGNTTTYRYYNNVTLPNLVKGDTASITINFWAAVDMEPLYFAIWIDYNHDNTFDTSEIVMQNAGTINAALPISATTISKVISIPLTAQTGATRMRFMRGTSATNPFTYSSAVRLPSCVTPSGGPGNIGCVYDYDVNITGASTTVKPVASFSANPLTGNMTTIFNFANTSTNSPTSNTWTFTPATVAYQNSTNANSSNPSVKFTAAGTYTVKLKVSNSAGADSVVRTNYITVSSVNAIPTVQGIAATHVFYPNPAGDVIYLSGNMEGAEVIVRDQLGRTVYHAAHQKGAISLTGLPAGIYSASAVMGTNRVTEQIVVIR